MFDYHHQPCSLDFASLTGPLSWPSLSAQSGQHLVSGSDIILDCYRHGCWDKATMSWKAAFVPLGTGLVSNTKDYYISLGDSAVAVLAWPLPHVPGAGEDPGRLVIRTDDDASASHLFIYEWNDCEVWPITVASPLSYYFARGCPRDCDRCIALRPQGNPISILSNAAQHAFWQLPKHDA